VSRLTSASSRTYGPAIDLPYFLRSVTVSGKQHICSPFRLLPSKIAQRIRGRASRGGRCSKCGKLVAPFATRSRWRREFLPSHQGCTSHSLVLLSKSPSEYPSVVFQGRIDRDKSAIHVGNGERRSCDTFQSRGAVSCASTSTRCSNVLIQIEQCLLGPRCVRLRQCGCRTIERDHRPHCGLAAHGDRNQR